MSDNDHSALGASSAARWMACPGSVALCATLPPAPDTQYSREGTAAHRLIEICMRGETVDGEEIRFPEKLIGKTILGVVVTKEMVKAVSVYINHVRGVYSKHQGLKIYTEQKVHLRAFDDEFYGRNDNTILTADGTLYTFDYKHGAGVPVEVEDNPQLKYYALGALLAEGGGVERVVLTVIQPRCEHPDGPIREWEIDTSGLIEFGFELAAAANATRSPNALLHSGKHCRFCPASGACPELYREALHSAGLEFSDTAARLADATPIAFEGLSPEELGARLELAERLTAWVSALHTYAYNEALHGRMPARRKFVAKRGRRHWLDADLALSKAHQLFGVTHDDVYTKKPISPAEFEKLVGKSAAKPFLNMHAESRSSGFKLVPISAKGEALTPEALSEFEPIEETSDEA